MDIRPRTKTEINFKDAPFAFVTNLYRHTKTISYRETEVLSATTTCCNEDVEKNQYGFDEECPCCGKEICWDTRERDAYVSEEKAKISSLLVKEKAEIEENLEKLLKEIASETTTIEDFALALIGNIDGYNSPGWELEKSYFQSNNSYETEKAFVQFKKKKDIDFKKWQSIDIELTITFTKDKIVLKETETVWRRNRDDDWDAECHLLRKDVVSTKGCKEFVESCFKAIDEKERPERLRKSKIEEMGNEIRKCFASKNYSGVFEVYRKYGEYLDNIPTPVEILKKIARNEGCKDFCTFEQNDDGWVLKSDNVSEEVLEDGTPGTRYAMKEIASGNGVLCQELQPYIEFFQWDSKRDEEYIEKCLSNTFVLKIEKDLSFGEEYVSENDEVCIPIVSEPLILRGLEIDEHDESLEDDLNEYDIYLNEDYDGFEDEDGDSVDWDRVDKTISEIVMGYVEDESIKLMAVKDGDSFKLVLDIEDCDVPECIDYANPSGEVNLTKTEREYLGKFIEFEKEPIREEEM